MKRFAKKHGPKIKFFLAGIWNTIFGYGLFVVMYHLFSAHIHYMIIMILSSIVSITNAFISYRFFVFRSKGDILREYLKFYLVYGFTMIANIILLPILVEGFKVHPVAAQGLTIFITFICSYYGHKNFSFRN